MNDWHDLQSALVRVAGGAIITGWRGIEHGIAGVFSTTKRVSWAYLLVSAAVALSVLWVRRRRQGKRDLAGLLRALAPREIYLHPSSLQDYIWFVLSPAVWVPLVASVEFVLPILSVWVRDGLVHTLGPAHPLGPAHELTPSVPAQVVCAFLVFFAVDLGNYVSHWLMHHVGFLWEFHKTHHSAEVLNPATADRLHPLERLLIESCGAVTLGLTVGVLRYLYGPHLSISRVFGINVFAVITNVISGNLRHSHVWVSYGPVLERIFSSPAQHQIHHSRHPDHLDKNLATSFALWDWLFGTLYVPPAKPQPLVFGLADRTEHLYRNPWALFARPFQSNWARLRAFLAH